MQTLPTLEITLNEEEDIRLDAYWFANLKPMLLAQIRRDNCLKCIGEQLIDCHKEQKQIVKKALKRDEPGMLHEQKDYGIKLICTDYKSLRFRENQMRQEFQSLQLNNAA